MSVAEVDVEGKYVRLKNNSEMARVMFAFFNVKSLQYILVKHLILGDSVSLSAG